MLRYHLFVECDRVFACAEIKSNTHEYLLRTPCEDGAKTNEVMSCLNSKRMYLLFSVPLHVSLLLNISFFLCHKTFVELS